MQRKEIRREAGGLGDGGLGGPGRAASRPKREEKSGRSEVARERGYFLAREAHRKSSGH